MARLLVLVLLVGCLAAPATATAQSSGPFNPIPPVIQTATPAPTVAPSTADQQDVSRGVLLIIAGAVLVIFIFIGWYITRDARSHLTDADRRAIDHVRTPEEQRRGEEVRRRARAKGKRQRQARKAQRRR